MVAQKKRDASTTPARDGFPSFFRRYQAHNPATGKKARSEEFVNAATPQSRPNAIQGIPPLSSSISSVSQKINASNRAARLVSHTQRAHQYITVGRSAHPHALH